ncbi:unnamed protein product [Linum trigynum]|uniref:Uncharacterized protein n=1 Tax=Linum trigynum TaxID=586398 RepID=A0AAV2D986_9ROSI
MASTIGGGIHNHPNGGTPELHGVNKKGEACAQLSHNRLPPLEEREEVKEASHDDFGRMSSDMDFQPLPPPGLTLEEKATRACESIRLSLLEEKEEVEGALNDNSFKQEELTSESSRGEDEQEGCIDDSHHFPLR